MKKIKRYAVAVTRTVTYIEIVVAEGDADTAHDAALERVRDVKTDGSTFKYVGHSDEAKVLDIYI